MSDIEKRFYRNCVEGRGTEVIVWGEEMGKLVVEDAARNCGLYDGSKVLPVSLEHDGVSIDPKINVSTLGDIVIWCNQTDCSYNSGY